MEFLVLVIFRTVVIVGGAWGVMALTLVVILSVRRGGLEVIWPAILCGSLAALLWLCACLTYFWGPV